MINDLKLYLIQFKKFEIITVFLKSYQLWQNSVDYSSLNQIKTVPHRIFSTPKNSALT